MVSCFTRVPTIIVYQNRMVHSKFEIKSCDHIVALIQELQTETSPRPARPHAMRCFTHKKGDGNADLIWWIYFALKQTTDTVDA